MRQLHEVEHLLRSGLVLHGCGFSCHAVFSVLRVDIGVAHQPKLIRLHSLIFERAVGWINAQVARKVTRLDHQRLVSQH